MENQPTRTANQNGESLPQTDEFRIRLATLDDLEILADHRRAMFVDMGHTDDAALDQMSAAFIPWVAERIQRGEYFSLLMVNAQDTIVAGAAVWLIDWPPGPLDLSCRRGYILNVYTHPDYRQRGLARRVVRATIDLCQQRGIRFIGLHASDAGRHLYETLGFTPTNEFRLTLQQDA